MQWLQVTELLFRCSVNFMHLKASRSSLLQSTESRQSETIMAEHTGKVEFELMPHIIHFDKCKLTLKIAGIETQTARKGNTNVLLTQKQI